MMKKDHRKVRSRNEAFARRTATRIWQEKASEKNPYIAESSLCYGYDILELMEKRSFVDVLFLLFRGELPTAAQATLLEQLMIALINPGPRHPATRAAMLAGASKTDPANILPISLSILGGSYSGAGEIEAAVLFLQEHNHKSPEEVALTLLGREDRSSQGDWRPAAGFGTRFGGIDELPRQIAGRLAALPAAGKNLSWGCAFADALEPHGLGWLSTGVAAAAFADLGFQPRAGAGMFQLLNAPGLLAHGAEFAYKPMTAMPFPKDEDYFIEGD